MKLDYPVTGIGQGAGRLDLNKYRWGSNKALSGDVMSNQESKEIQGQVRQLENSFFKGPGSSVVSTYELLSGVLHTGK